MTYPQASPSRPLVFVHVPKTSGSSINGVVEKMIGLADTRSVAGQRRSADGIETLRRDKGKFRYVGGHIKYLEAAAIFESALYVTAIRHPLHRILSHYFHKLRNDPPDRISDFIKDLPGEGFRAYYRRARFARRNMSCDYICGEQDHQKAIQFLKDYFSATWLADHPETGWPYVFRMLVPDPRAKVRRLGSRNVAPLAHDASSLAAGARPQNYDTFLAKENLDWLLADNAEDLKLYEWFLSEGGLLLSPELREAAAEAPLQPARLAAS